jgi:PAS domain S-box-containing protein
MSRRANASAAQLEPTPALEQDSAAIRPGKSSGITDPGHPSQQDQVLDSLPSIIIQLDDSGRISAWNARAKTVFGVQREIALGKTLAASGVAWLGGKLEVDLDHWRSDELPRRYDNILFERDGEKRCWAFVAHPLRQGGRDPVGVLITGADVTERRNQEQQEQQRQKLQAIGQLASGIAHEINTPTQYVSDNITFLRDSWQELDQLLEMVSKLSTALEAGASAQDQVAILGRTAEQVDLLYLRKEIPKSIAQSLEGLRKVAMIVRAMREFSHPGSPDKCAININEAIETTVTVARSEWKYVAELVTHLDPHLPQVFAIAGEFNQVILNLVVNAAHAIASKSKDTAVNGKITIATRQDGDSVEIDISDTGPGIPEAIRSRIFEPFFTTKELGKGTGQGLMLAHTIIVDKHKGKLWFDTEVGKGTTFHIRLPIKPAAKAMHA